jgi:hypothetical protein
MARRRRRSRGDEFLTRTVEVSSCTTRVHVGIDQPRGCEPMIESRPWIEAHGTADEPLGDDFDFAVNVQVDDDLRPGPLRPAGVGAIVQLRPQVTAVLGLPHADFDRLWSMAVTGRLRFVWLSTMKPRYGKARIRSASFSSEREE